MKTLSTLLALVALLTLSGVALAQCPGGTCPAPRPSSGTVVRPGSYPRPTIFNPRPSGVWIIR